MKCSSVVRVKRGFACAEDNTQACEFHISACSKRLVLGHLAKHQKFTPAGLISWEGKEISMQTF